MYKALFLKRPYDYSSTRTSLSRCGLRLDWERCKKIFVLWPSHCSSSNQLLKQWKCGV